MTKIPGVGEYDKHPLEWKFQGGGGSTTKVPSFGEVWIFFGTTHSKELKVRILVDKLFNSVMLTGCFIMLLEQLLKALSWM